MIPMVLKKESPGRGFLFSFQNPRIYIPPLSLTLHEHRIQNVQQETPAAPLPRDLDIFNQASAR